MTLPQPVDFSFLDQDEFKTKYAVDSAAMNFYVEGIRCEKCVRKLEGMVGTLAGLRRLRVEMGKSLVHVEVDPSLLAFSTVASAIEQQGFRPIPLAKEDDFFTLQRREDRSDLMRLAAAAGCAGNIMTFAFATYFGGPFALFAGLSFLLYLPVVTYVAWPFYRGAWQALRQMRISIDLPMAVASLLGFGFSSFELIQGRSDIYFDSLSGFLFLILLARLVQKRLQRKFLSASELMEGLALGRVRILAMVGFEWRTLENLRIGDSFLVTESETLPADGELQSPQAYFSLAWLSGEAKPKLFLKGAVIPAGARLISPEARLTARKMLSETGFGKILQQVQKFSLSDNQTVQISDRLAQWLLGTVFLCAITFLIFYWPVSAVEALRRAISLLIVACPCAMAFGTPLALAFSLKRARQLGLITRDAKVFAAAQQVKTLCFDKTGTLTDLESCLLDKPAEISPLQQKIILSLENASLHPMAFAFRKAFSPFEDLPAVEDFQELPGVGVVGRIFGKNYELRKHLCSSNETSCALFEDGHWQRDFHFSSTLKPTSKATLEHLRLRGYKPILLSGDRRAIATKTGQALGFQPEEIFAELSPIDKAHLVTRYAPAMMVGDGVNDSLAMMRATVGVAVSGGVEAALKSAAVYLVEPGIQGVAALLDVSETAYALIRQNLLISLIYNVSAGSLALLGYINPFVAAILMPISSGLILLNTWLRSRQ